MKNKSLKVFVTLFSFSLILFIGCSKPTEPNVLSVSRSLITLSPGGKTISESFTVTSSTPWTIINGNPSWLNLSQSTGEAGTFTVTVSAPPNEVYYTNIAELILYSSGVAPKKITVQQEKANRLTDIAGTDAPGYQDGDASSAQFFTITSIAADVTASKIYVGDEVNQAVRLVDLSNNTVSTLPGKGSLGNLWGVTTDIYGNVYTAGSSTLFKIDNTGPESIYSADNNLGVNIISSNPLIGRGIFFVNGNQINKITPTGNIEVVAGKKETAFYQDGPGITAGFNFPIGIAVGYSSIYVIDNYPAIRAISDNGVVSTLAGTLERGFRDGEIKQSRFSAIVGITVTNDGTIYVLDQSGAYIRKISNGYVTTLSLPNFSSQFLAITSVGNWVFVSTGNRIFRLD